MAEGKVLRALLYTCKDYGFASKNNHVEDRPYKIFEATDHTFIMRAFVDFAKCVERTRLVLELDDGSEIGIMPVLQDSHQSRHHGPDSPVKWDISVDIWPD